MRVGLVASAENDSYALGYPGHHVDVAERCRAYPELFLDQGPKLAAKEGG